MPHPPANSELLDILGEPGDLWPLGTIFSEKFSRGNRRNFYKIVDYVNYEVFVDDDGEKYVDGYYDCQCCTQKGKLQQSKTWRGISILNNDVQIYNNDYLITEIIEVGTVDKY